MKTFIFVVMAVASILMDVQAQPTTVLDSAPHTLEFRPTNDLLYRGTAPPGFPVYGHRWKTNHVVTEQVVLEPIPPLRYYYTVQPGGVMSFIGAFDNPVEPLTRLRSGSQEFVDGHTCILTFAEEVKDGQVLWQFKPGFHVRTKPPNVLPPPLPLITRTNDSIIHSIITRNP